MSDESSNRVSVIARVGGSIAAVACVTLIDTQLLRVDHTTVALTYLVVILVIASRWGIVAGTTASLAAGVAFNFFFLPPVWTLTIADPQNWVALMAFVTTAIVVSQLSGRARLRTLQALAREAAARAEGARASSELRATVLDALAHEFKTPLTSMKAASSDLLMSASLDGRQRELVAIMDEGLDRLNDVVTDAVRMLRIDAGEFTVNASRHRLADDVAAAVAPFERSLEGHQLVQDIPNDLVVEADGDLLRLALRQLLDNAIKYSPPSSAIGIHAAVSGTVAVSVQNSGSLIAEPDRPRLADRFYRGSQARHIPGSGMGLAIVQQIARVHGGGLTIDSSPERGTTFTVTLTAGGRP